MTSTSAPRIERIRASLLQVERKGIEPVSETDRRGRPALLFSLWASSNVQFATLTSGILATAVFGLSLWQSIIAIALGSGVGGACIGAMSRYGPRFGTSQLVQSRGPFGYLGNVVVALLVIVKASCWFAVETVLGTFTLEVLLGMAFGPAFAVVIGFQVLIALVGHDLIHGFQKVMTVLLPAIVLAMSVYCFGHADFGKPFAADVAGGLGFSGAFILTLAIQAARSMSFSAYASDYSRYLPRSASGRGIFLAAAGGTLVASLWMGSVGAAIGTYTTVGTPADLVHNALPSALGVIALVGLLLTNTLTACLDCYSGSMAALLLDLPMRRWHSVLMVGTIGGVIGWLGGRGDFWTNFQTFLFLLGYWVGPWLGVMLVYFDIARREQRTKALYDRARRVRPGLYAFVIGLVCSIPFMNQQGVFVGPVAQSNPGLGDVTALVGFAVAAVVCWIGFRARPGEPEAGNPADDTYEERTVAGESA